MAELRAVSHTEFRSRRIRASATVVVSVSVESVEARPRPKKPVRALTEERAWVPLGLTDPAVRWDVLPERIRPEGWITETADPAVPGSVLAAEELRRPEGFYPGG